MAKGQSVKPKEQVTFEVSGKKYYFDAEEFRKAAEYAHIEVVPTPTELETFKPLDNRVLVKEDNEQNVTKSGIIIPDTAKERPFKGTVLKVGPGSVTTHGLIPNSVKEGDRILFGKYSGQEVILDGNTYLIMREQDILAVL